MPPCCPDSAVLAAGGPSDFALPYWNYDKPFPGNTIPIGFRTQTLPDGTANPLSLQSPRRRASLMSGRQLSPIVTSPANALNQTDFTSPAASSRWLQASSRGSHGFP